MQPRTATRFILSFLTAFAPVRAAAWPPFLAPVGPAPGVAGSGPQTAAQNALLLNGAASQSGGQMARDSKKEEDEKKRQALMAMAMMQMAQANAAKNAQQKNEEAQEKMSESDPVSAVPKPPPLEDPKITFKGPDEAKVQVKPFPPAGDVASPALPDNGGALSQLAQLGPAPAHPAAAPGAAVPPQQLASLSTEGPREPAAARLVGQPSTPASIPKAPSAELAVLSTGPLPGGVAVGPSGRDVLASLDTGALLPEGRGIVERETSVDSGRGRETSGGEGEGSDSGKASSTPAGSGRASGLGASIERLGDLLSPFPSSKRGRRAKSLDARRGKKVFANLFEAASDRFHSLAAEKKLAPKRGGEPKSVPGAAVAARARNKG